MRLMNSEMRSNMSAFDYGERSLKKYGVQLDGLNKKLELQKTVTESARKHYEKMVAEHGEGSRQAQNAAAAYNHEAVQLNNLERHIQKVTAEMKEFERQQAIQNSTLYKSGDALENFGNRLGDISSKARDVGGSLTRYLTAPIAGIVATIGGMGFKRAMDIEQVQMMMEHISDDSAEYEKRMENVVDLVTDTRFGTAELGAEYAKFIGASAKDTSAKLYSEVAMNLASFKSNDQLIPQIGGLYTKALQSGKIDGQMINQFTNAGVDIIKVLGNKWGMTTDQVKDRLKSGSVDIHQVLDELSEGILEGTEGELGVTKAMGGMLEKSGRTLSGQIKNFFAAISQTGERLIKDTGLFDGVKNSLDELRNMLKSGELDSILIPTFQGLAKAMEALIDIARKVFKWFSSLDDSTKEWIGKLVGLAVVIGPIITGFGIFGGIIAKLSTGLGTFMKFLAPIMTPLKGVGAVAAEGGKKVGLLSRAFTFLTGPIGITIGVISLLVGGFTALYKRSENFRESMGPVIERLKEIGGTIKDYLLEGLESIKVFFGEIKKRFTSFKDEEGSQLMSAFENIGKFTSIVFNGILAVVQFVMPLVFSIIKSVWGNIKGVITGALDIIMGAIKIFSGLFTGDWKKMWEGIKQLLKGAVTFAWNYISLMFIGRILKGIGGFAKNIVSTLKGGWDKAINGIKSFVGTAGKWFSDLLKRGLKIFDDIVAGAKALPGKMANGITSAAGKAVSAVKKLGNSILTTIGKPINGVIRGINWVLGKLSLKTKIGLWTVPQYAHGTDGHPGGLAVVGDGKGSNAGRELVQTPDGQSFLSPAKPTLTFLPKGTQVLSAKETRGLFDVPMYAKGIGGAIKKGAQKVKDTIASVWDHISNPSKLLDLGLNALGISKPDNSTLIGKMARGGFNFIKDKAIGYLKDAVKNMFGSGAAPTSGGAAAWRPMIVQAAARMGESITEAQIKGIIAQIHRESGGNQAIVQSPSVYDINIARGNPARGLLQYIPQTFKRFAVKGHGNIYSGYDQLLAFFNNTNWRKDLPYGRRGWGPTGKRKFESGGLIKSMGLYQLAEGGWPEWIIPTDPKRRTDAMKLLALAAKDINGNKRPNQLPNVNNQYDDRLLNAILEQNEILLQLLEKDGDVYIDGERAGKILAPLIKRHLERAQIRKMRGRGIPT